MQEVGSQHFGRWGKPVAIAGAIASVATVVALLTPLFGPEKPDANQAEAFLKQYFADAPRNPRATWARLTDSYRTEKADDPNDPLTYPSYVDFYRRYTSIEVAEFGASELGDGWWHATLVFTDRQGRDTKLHRRYELVCPTRTRLPGIQCETKDIRLNASVEPTS